MNMEYKDLTKTERFGIPETINAFKQEFKKNNLNDFDAALILIFARERWTGLRSPLNRRENLPILKYIELIRQKLRK